MPIKIGANPLCWMNSDFPHLGSGVSIEQCLSDIAMIGYQGVELEDPFLKIIEQLPFLFSSTQLQCIGKWHSTFILENSFEKEMDRLKKHLEMLARLNSEVVILCECSGAIHQQKKTSLSHRPKIQSDSKWKSLSSGLEKMAEFIHHEGFISAYHHHMGSVIQTHQEINQLMKQTESLGLLLDTGHLVYGEDNPIEVLKKHIHRIKHVHCKSIRPSVLQSKLKEDSSFFSAVVDGIFTVPGDIEDGQENELIDFGEIISALTDYNYSGWVVMEAEQDPNKAEPFHYAQIGYQTLSSLVLN